MRRYAFPALDREADGLCRALFLADDQASRVNPDSTHRKELRRLLNTHDLQVVELLRQLAGRTPGAIQ